MSAKMYFDKFTKKCERLAEMNIVSAKMPTNLTNFLQPLDLTTNMTIKNIERREFNNYFTPHRGSVLNYPSKDVTTIKVGLRL